MATRPATQRFDWSPFGLAILAVLMGTLLGLLVTSVANPIWVLAIVVGTLVVFATIARTEVGLLALVFISYTNLSDVLLRNHHIPSIAQPLVALLVIAILARWLLYSEEPRGWLRATALVLLYGLIGLASLFWAADATATENALAEFAKNAAITVVVVILLQRGETFRGVVWALLLSGIFMGSITVLQQLTGNFDSDYGGMALAPLQNIVGQVSGYRVSGPIGDPNFYGQILIVVVPLALERLWHERSLVLRLAALWALGVSLLSIFFTFSRGAFIGLVVVIVLMFVRRPPKFVTLIATLAILIVAIKFMPVQYLSRLSTLSDIIPGWGDPRTEISLRGRLSENTVAWMMFSDHPILGVGLDNYPALYQQYSRQLGLDPRLEPRDPHNLYLEIASQLGLVGLAVFGVLVWFMFRGLLQAHRDFRAGAMKDYAEMTAAFAIAMFGYLSAALFLHSAYDRYFWLLFGIGLALPQVARHELASRDLVEETHLEDPPIPELPGPEGT